MTHKELTIQGRRQEVWTTKPRKLRSFLRDVRLEEAEIRGRIRQAREEVGLTQEQAADVHEVHKRTIENWENSYVPWDKINQIAERYGKTTEWLLHGEGFVPDAELREIIRQAVAEERQELVDALRGLQEGLQRLEEKLP